MESTPHEGVSAKDIPGYIPPYRHGVQPRKLTKNQKYQVKMSTIPQGMVCTTDIVPVLIQMKYVDHDLLAL